MNNVNETFADLPDHFVDAINANIGSLRQSRCLCLSFMTFVWLNSGTDGYALVDAPGGGMVTWYLCRYQGNLHFVFQSYTANDANPYRYSARETTRYEVDELLYSYGGGIYDSNGICQPYEVFAGEQPPRQQNQDFDFDALIGGLEQDQLAHRPRDQLYDDSINESKRQKLD